MRTIPHFLLLFHVNYRFDFYHSFLIAIIIPAGTITVTVKPTTKHKTKQNKPSPQTANTSYSHTHAFSPVEENSVPAGLTDTGVLHCLTFPSIGKAVGIVANTFHKN